MNTVTFDFTFGPEKATMLSFLTFVLFFSLFTNPAIGSEETNQPPQIIITSPTNTTYTTNQVNFDFTVTDDNSTTFHVKAYSDGSLIYDSSSYANGTEVSLSLINLTDGTRWVKVWANDTDSIAPSISEQTVYFTVSTIQNKLNQILNELYWLEDLTLALHSTPVTSKYCVDENHLVIVKTATWKVDNREIPIVKNETEYCEYGCDNSTLRCRPAPYVRNSIIFGVLFIVGLLIYFIKRMI